MHLWLIPSVSRTVRHGTCGAVGSVVVVFFHTDDHGTGGTWSLHSYQSSGGRCASRENLMSVQRHSLNKAWKSLYMGGCKSPPSHSTAALSGSSGAGSGRVLGGWAFCAGQGCEWASEWLTSGKSLRSRCQWDYRLISIFLCVTVVFSPPLPKCSPTNE